MVELLIIALIAFCINNLIWTVFVVYLVSLVQNKSLPKIFGKKLNTDEGVEEFKEATDEQISEQLDKLQNIAKEKFGFDENGTPTKVKEERVVE